ncbi:TonB-dependent receptor [Novosphingobium sp. FSY-8]|uniref:TonB-dependent receptor n=1 Tax=Novosphingobium ovatum TaxID=1908523 RepID=A0ABW9XEQ3_9SPHN|nr:TonB-dependent receptor [Novosphingobium ovatum]NBC37018.1 TonB-dependent receptor [Novosphingobium ovatum]
MRTNRGIIRPASLRQRSAALAAGLSAAAAIATPAIAQTAAQPAPADEQEVQLDTLKIQGRTADVNPYAQEGAPYKARVSGDSRRTRPLAETPQTITVITETQIKESGRTDLRSILALQPGVTVGTGENGNKFGDRYVLRGQELKSDVFVDGLRDPGMTIRESFNVEQVELTKGPSSTFAGRGSSGGAVNAITKQASTEYNFVNADVTGGTDEYARLTTDANIKLSDSFALRGNVLYSREDVPERSPANRKRFGTSLSALMKPAHNFSMTVDYYHLTANDYPDLGTYFSAAGGTPVKNVPVYTQQGDFVRSSVNTLTAKIKWNIADGFRLENAARYGTAHNGFVNTGARLATRSASDPTAPGAVDTVLDTGHQGWQRIEYLVDQLNLFADAKLLGMKHSFLIGGELSHNKVLNGTYTLTRSGAYNCATGTSTTLNAWCVGNGVANIDTVQGKSYVQGAWNVDWQVDTRSVYLMDTVDLTKWLTLFGGARLDNYDYKLVTQSGTTQTPYSYSGNLWNFHGGLSVKPVHDGQFYFSFGTATNINGGESDVGTSCGYGGFCTVSGTNYYGSPVKTTNFEIGTKWEIFKHTLMLTAAAFKLYKDGVFQTATGDSYSTSGTLNTGRYKVEGIELGAVGNITPRLSTQIGMSFLRSRVLASTTAAEVGKKLSNFANVQINAQLKYQLTDKLGIGGNVNHRSSMAAGQPDTAAVYSTTLGTYSYQLPAYTTFDAFATYKVNSHFEARVNVQNVGNTDYYLAAYRSGTFVYIGDKRRVTFTLSGKF